MAIEEKKNERKKRVTLERCRKGGGGGVGKGKGKTYIKSTHPKTALLRFSKCKDGGGDLIVT